MTTDLRPPQPVDIRECAAQKLAEQAERFDAMGKVAESLFTYPDVPLRFEQMARELRSVVDLIERSDRQAEELAAALLGVDPPPLSERDALIKAAHHALGLTGPPLSPAAASIVDAGWRPMPVAER